MMQAFDQALSSEERNRERASEDETSLIRVPFPDDQLERTHRAASLVFSDFQEYCQRAIEIETSKSLVKRTAANPLPNNRANILNDQGPVYGHEED